MDGKKIGIICDLIKSSEKDELEEMASMIKNAINLIYFDERAKGYYDNRPQTDDCGLDVSF